MAKKAAYCHFSFRRPRGTDIGIFAAAIYADFEGKRLVTRKVRQYRLWKNHQHVTAIQSYEHALRCISEWQGELMQHGVTNVLLVTDNSILAGWIMDPKKNKGYTDYMERASKLYRLGAPKEIMLAIGLCEPRDAEKSHKFCKEELVENELEAAEISCDTQHTTNKLDIGNDYQTVLDIIDADKPEVNGEITEL